MNVAVRSTADIVSPSTSLYVVDTLGMFHLIGASGPYVIEFESTPYLFLHFIHRFIFYHELGDKIFARNGLPKFLLTAHTNNPF